MIIADFGFTIADFKSEIPNLQSEIKINPKSKFRNPKSNFYLQIYIRIQPLYGSAFCQIPYQFSFAES